MIYDPSIRTRPLCIPEAIAKQEGWNMGAQARCFRLCNPGDLNYEPWETQFGAVLETVPEGDTARFAAFPDAESGFAALVHLCGFPRYKGGTLGNLIAAWAPPSDGNDTGAYLANVCAWCQLTPETIIDGYLSPPV